MPVYQTNVWICEDCGKIESFTVETSPYDDPVVVPNGEWGYTETGHELLCPECLTKLKPSE